MLSLSKFQKMKHLTCRSDCRPELLEHSKSCSNDVPTKKRSVYAGFKALLEHWNIWNKKHIYLYAREYIRQILIYTFLARENNTKNVPNVPTRPEKPVFMRVFLLEHVFQHCSKCSNKN